VHVEDVFAIAAQEADALLIGEQAERPLGKVKERTDAGVGLTVIVAKCSFIIAA